MSLWPHQQKCLEEVPSRLLRGACKLCVTSPTGGGKTAMICGLIEWALAQGWEAILYSNRRLLIDQLGRVLKKHGIDFGVRASGHAEDLEQAVQVSSLPTERTRTLASERWRIHGHGKPTLAIVDEAHLNKSETAETILGRHYDAGHAYVGFTATPIDLGHLYDSLLVCGVPSELRACGALVPAYHYGPDEPDMSRFKANIKTGEYSEGDVRKAIMTKCIFGRVLENYRKYNADRRPTILFAPGVPESIWFAEELTNHGVRSAHIDGNGIWRDGEYQQTTDPDERRRLLEAVRGGEYLLCNRYVAREGLDLPEVSHLILATVMGSLQTYLQSAGRGLRAAPGKDRCTIQDHGGHWHRHGSVNLDRHWHLNYTETIVRGMREERLRNKSEPEPILCPKCGLVRKAGPKCPACGHEASKRSRLVMQHNGQLREHVGDIYKPRVVKELPTTERIWLQCYHRARNSKNHMNFRQAEALFFVENHYYPPRTLPKMPTNELDWYLAVRDVPAERLQ